MFMKPPAHLMRALNVLGHLHDRPEMMRGYRAVRKDDAGPDMPLHYGPTKMVPLMYRAAQPEISTRPPRSRQKSSPPRLETCRA